MATFSKRLKDLRASAGLTLKAMAEQLNMVQRNYQRYENGSIDPSLSKIIAIADYFDVPIEYLVGRTDNPITPSERVSPLFSVRLKELRIRKGVSLFQAAKLFEITERNYAGYEEGEAMPDIDKLIALADYFDVSLDYLVGRSDEPERNL